MTDTPRPVPSAPPVPPKARRRTIGYLFIALFLAGCLTGGYFLWTDRTTITPPEPALDHIEAAPAEAIRKARAQVVATPRNAQAWGEYGMVLHIHDFYVDAQKCYVVAEQYDSSNPMWPYLLGDCCFHDGETQDAIDHFRRAVNRSDSDPSAQLRLGELLVGAGQLEEAASLFQMVHGGNPQHPRAHLGLARVELARGHARKSLSHISNCLSVTGDTAEACQLLAETYHELGEQDLAADATQRAKRAAPFPPWPDTYLHQLYSKQLGTLAAGQRAAAHFRAGRRAEAIRELTDLVAQQPDSPKALGALGRIYVQCEQPAEALPHLQKALKLDPELVEARFYLASALMLLDKFDEAVVEFRKVVEQKPDYAEANHRLGQCYYRLGNKVSAAAVLQESVRYAPNNAKAQKNLAVVLFELRRYDESVKHFEFAATLTPGDREIPGLLKRAKAAASNPPK